MSMVFSGSCQATSPFLMITARPRGTFLNIKRDLVLTKFHPFRSSRYLREKLCIVSPQRLRLPKSAPEGLPTELVEDPKFVPLNEDDPRFGPPALLLLGFNYDEVEKVQTLLKDMDGEFLKILTCTPDMLKQSLWDAMHVQQTNLRTIKVAEGLPRICFISGLDGEETMMFINAFPETGLKSTVFAALVPNSAGKSIEELIEEIMGDHERLTGAQQ
eukprot:TRINITY_DN20071_c0_g1_i1.p1 TRINITY_DN20071_c0_g1~~TRINITY_DN20071_c0_g1_i1.p1  ORF type:complete len:216 (-),score=41.62 TRINITY_DN20071_c0_g1_i1:92-739(-)